MVDALVDPLVGGVRRFTLSWGHPFQAESNPGGPVGGKRPPTHTPHVGIRHPQDSTSVHLLVWGVGLGGLAHSTIGYGTRGCNGNMQI